MIAISNSGLANLGIPPVNTSLMTPVVTFVADYGAKTLTATSATTVTSPETFRHANVVITDSGGDSVYGAITTRTGNTGALDIQHLKQTGDMTIKVVMVSTLGIIAVGIGTFSPSLLTGSVGDWEISFTTCNGQ